MNCPSRNDDTLLHPTWNQSPCYLTADLTTRQDLNGNVNFRGCRNDVEKLREEELYAAVEDGNSTKDNVLVWNELVKLDRGLYMNLSEEVQRTKNWPKVCFLFKNFTKLHGIGAYVFRGSLLLNLAFFAVIYLSPVEKTNLISELHGKLLQNLLPIRY